MQIPPLLKRNKQLPAILTAVAILHWSWSTTDGRNLAGSRLQTELASGTESRILGDRVMKTARDKKHKDTEETRKDPLPATLPLPS